MHAKTGWLPIYALCDYGNGYYDRRPDLSPGVILVRAPQIMLSSHKSQSTYFGLLVHVNESMYMLLESCIMHGEGGNHGDDEDAADDTRCFTYK